MPTYEPRDSRDRYELREAHEPQDSRNPHHPGERAWNDDETRDRESVLADLTKRRARSEADEAKAKPPILPAKEPAIEVDDDPDDPTGEGVVTRLRVTGD